MFIFVSINNVIECLRTRTLLVEHDRGVISVALLVHAQIDLRMLQQQFDELGVALGAAPVERRLFVLIGGVDVRVMLEQELRNLQANERESSEKGIVVGIYRVEVLRASVVQRSRTGRIRLLDVDFVRL